MQDLIDEKYKELEKELNAKLECEKSYINFLDDDFSSMKDHVLNPADLHPNTKASLQASFSVKPQVFTPLPNLGPEPVDWSQSTVSETISSFGSLSDRNFIEEDSEMRISFSSEVEREDISNVWTIKKVIHCYFCAIIKHYKADIPKYIVNFLIKKTNEDMHSLLMSEIFNLKDLESLINENPDIVKRRIIVKTNITKLEDALSSIDTIFRHQQDYDY